MDVVGHRSVFRSLLAIYAYLGIGMARPLLPQTTARLRTARLSQRVALTRRPRSSSVSLTSTIPASAKPYNLAVPWLCWRGIYVEHDPEILARAGRFLACLLPIRQETLRWLQRLRITRPTSVRGFRVGSRFLLEGDRLHPAGAAAALPLVRLVRASVLVLTLLIRERLR